MENKKNVVFSIIVVTIIVWGLYEFFKRDSYVGFYYPDVNNLLNDIQSNNSFDSLEACRDWIDEQKTTYNPNGTKQDDYECGKNCDLSGGKPYICEETLE